MNQKTFMALLAALPLCLGGPVLADDDDDDEEELEFEEAEIFFELNDTDGDLGIHALIDGEGWKRIEMEGPRGSLLKVRAKGGIRRQGLTEFFFESAEPTFDELDPRTFFRRFPEGEYGVEGLTVDGQEIRGETVVTHAIPAPAVVTVNGSPFDDDCDDDLFSAAVSAPVTIDWEPVSLSHPDADGPGAGVQPPVPVEIVNYQLVVEAELELDGEEFVSVYSLVLPPDVTSATVPDALLGLTDEFKYEVLAREASYNQTAVESCFVLE